MSESQIRVIFDEDAKLYDEMRPGYPEALVRDILELSGISENSKILEIGCGTGQATKPFVQRGFPILCLDVGKNMIAVACQKFRNFSNVKFLAVSFEEWSAGKEQFDLVISATAFHWITPEIRLKKAATILRDGGDIAVFRNVYPDTDKDKDFFCALHDVYRDSVPEWNISQKEKKYKSNYERKIKMLEDEIDNTGLFHKTSIRRYPWSVKYSSEEYVRLLNTYSDHRNLKESTKRKLFYKIVKLIDQFGGTITRPYLSVLHFAKKKG